MTPLPTTAWSGRRVFLTGHTGFKGGWLATWLKHLGAEVIGFSLAAEPMSLGALLNIEQECASIEGDIRDLARLKSALKQSRADVVFHLAAQALVRLSYVEPIETLHTNIIGTANLLEAVRETPSVKAVVVITTDKCYENREWAWPYRETDALGGHDPYSASKAGAELVTASWRRSFLATKNVAVASVRAGNVVGGGDWSVDRLVPDCIRAFSERRTVSIRNPIATRPWQHVLDPLCGYMLLAERLLNEPTAADAWNFGPGPDDVRPVLDVVKLLAQAWGPEAAWQVERGDHAHEAGLLAVDASKARAALGWRPRLRLQTGLQWSTDWYKNNLAGASARELVLRDIEQFCQLGNAL